MQIENDVTCAQAFNAENRLTSVIPSSGIATSFKYNGDGNLVAKLFGTVATYYVGGIYEVEVTNTTVTKKTTYYPAGGAIRVEDLVASTNNVYYILKDHLGSASVTLDSSGASIAEARYYPFGETRVTSGAMLTDQQFTGQRNLGANLGNIYYYGARMYSPKLGRFLSADTLVPEPSKPQALNRYAYVNNNPVNATDPSGHAACYDTGVEIGSGISQADCWAYGADKWIYGWDVAAPVAGAGYSTERGLINQTLIGFGFYAQGGDGDVGEIMLEIVQAYSNISVDMGCGSPCYNGYPFLRGQFQNWDANELNAVLLALTDIVKAYGGSSKFASLVGDFTIGRVSLPILSEIRSLAGATYGSKIALFDSAFQYGQFALTYLLAHEIGHVLDNKLGSNLFVSNGASQIFGNVIMKEDFADAVSFWTLDKLGYKPDEYIGLSGYNYKISSETANEWVQKIDALMTELDP